MDGIKLPKPGMYYANDEVHMGSLERKELNIEEIKSKLSNKEQEYDPIDWADCIYCYCTREEYLEVKEYFKKYGVQAVVVEFNRGNGLIKFKDPITVE